jgi:hypothetical protein
VNSAEIEDPYTAVKIYRNSVKIHKWQNQTRIAVSWAWLLMKRVVAPVNRVH